MSERLSSPQSPERSPLVEREETLHTPGQTRAFDTAVLAEWPVTAAEENGKPNVLGVELPTALAIDIAGAQGDLGRVQLLVLDVRGIQPNSQTNMKQVAVEPGELSRSARQRMWEIPGDAQFIVVNPAGWRADSYGQRAHSGWRALAPGQHISINPDTKDEQHGPLVFNSLQARDSCTISLEDGTLTVEEGTSGRLLTIKSMGTNEQATNEQPYEAEPPQPMAAETPFQPTPSAVEPTASYSAPAEVPPARDYAQEAAERAAERAADEERRAKIVDDARAKIEAGQVEQVAFNVVDLSKRDPETVHRLISLLIEHHVLDNAGAVLEFLRANPEISSNYEMRLFLGSMGIHYDYSPDSGIKDVHVAPSY